MFRTLAIKQNISIYGLRKVKERWLNDQKLLSNKGKKLERRNRSLKFLKNFLLPASILQAILLFFFFNQLSELSIFNINLKSLTLFLMGLFPFWLAIWDLYENKKAIGELHWQTDDQKKFFESALQQFDETQSIDVKKKILMTILRQSISELYHWMMNMYHREHEPPTGS